MTKTSDKVKKIVKGKKCDCKKLDPVYYQVQQDVEDNAAFRLLDHVADVHGLETLAAARTGLFDSDIVAGIIEQNKDLLRIDFVDMAEGPIGGFHTSIEKFAIARSTTERKGLRATLLVKTERYYDDKDSKEAGKETWREYRDVYPCDCASELLRDIMHEAGEVLFGHVNGEITKYNEKLECKGKCGEGCKCSK